MQATMQRQAATRTQMGGRAAAPQRAASAAAARAPMSRYRAAGAGADRRARGGRGGAALHVAGAGKVQKISGEQLEVEIANRDCTLVVDFFANWCGPCLLLATELEKVAEQLGDKVKVLKIDVDENQDLSSMLKIEGLPTIVFIPQDSSKPALRTEGLLPAQQIMDIVAEIAAPVAEQPAN